ncbi:MAG: peptide ABC transporter permease [Gammaproteobacteria bacterium]|nr:MAG: peptide ABC transporter permease [Gammaproteobacteria bacterium]
MLRFIAGRLLQAIPVLWVIVTLTFFLVRLAPGGPFDTERAVSPEVRAALEAHYGLDAPLWRQYLDYLAGVLRGDFGPSFKYANRSVTELIAAGFPVTAELGLWALSIAVLLGVGAGLIAALRPRRWPDHLAMSAAMLGICLPSFVLGPLLALLFGIVLGWLPVSGWGLTPGDKILPALTLGAGYAAYLARLTRGGLLEMLSQDFVRTARAKGAGELRVLLVHALRGGLVPVVAFLGPAAAGLLAGSFVVETVFQIPGLGRFFVQAAFNRDYTMVMGMTVFFSTLIVLFNLLADIALVWLDPRLRGAAGQGGGR